MHYRVNDLLIKSENSAKPAFSPSKDMLELLSEYISPNDTVLDFGCGKLRYSIPLTKNAKKVYAVDSEIQLSRAIKIKGEITSVIDLAKKNKITVYPTEKSQWKEKKYDRILLAHVLSTIPHNQDRLKIISDLKDAMHDESILIACSNHRMSYFKKWETSSKVEKFNNGYLIKEPNPSYFGIINKKLFRSYFSDNSFTILKLFIREDNTYCICKKRT